MALGLGQVLLSMAGGAAKEYNTQEAEKREHRRTLLQQTKKIHDMVDANAFAAEHASVREYNNNVDRISEKVNAFGGIDTEGGLIAYAKDYLGLSTPEEISLYVKNNLGKGTVNLPQHKQLPMFLGPNSQKMSNMIWDARTKARGPVVEESTPTTVVSTVSPDQSPTPVTTQSEVKPDSSGFLDLLNKPAVSYKIEKVGDKIVSIPVDNKTGATVGQTQTVFDATSPSMTETIPSLLQYKDKLVSELAKDPSNQQIKNNLTVIEDTINNKLKDKEGTQTEFQKHLDEYMSLFSTPKRTVEQEERFNLLKSKVDPEDKLKPVSAGYFKHKYESGAAPVQLLRVGMYYYYNGERINITDYDPMTEDTMTEKEKESTKRSSDLQGRVINYHSVQTALDDYTKTVTEESFGAAGFVQSFQIAVQSTFSGMMQLTGVMDRVTPEDAEKKLLNAGIDVNSYISNSSNALHGMNAGQAALMVYSLAGILHTEGDMAKTSVADIKRAADIVSKLNASKSGLGAIKSLKVYLKRGESYVHHKILRDTTMPAQDKVRSAKRIFQIQASESKDPRTTEILSKGIFSFDKDTGYVFFQPAGREDIKLNVEDIIDEVGNNGFLVPQLNVDPTR